MSVSQKVLDAIELLTNSSIQKAGFDKTIQAQILSCEDATIGKYKCRYQDATFFAYTNNTNLSFNKGAYVYILVPNGDMSKDKTILGSTQKLGVNYISQAVGEQAYDINGQNLINPNNDGEAFYLNTKTDSYRYSIPLTNLGLDTTISTSSNSNNRGIIEKFNQYIKASPSILIGATFKTSIDIESQYRGHFGIAFNLRFKDNATNEQVIRSYVLDENQMLGNPYRMQHKTRQYQIFDIDNENFVKVDSVQIFCSEFPDAGTEQLDHTPIRNTDSWNIEITNIEFVAATRMKQMQINGVSISFFTPQGTFFYEADNPATAKKTIIAQVRVKGKLVSDSQNIPFYWGRQRVGVNNNSQYYNSHLGKGWQCLNKNNIVNAGTQSTNPTVEWVPSKNSFVVNMSQATAKHNRFKVAIVYDNNTISKEIDIQNLKPGETFDLNIESIDSEKEIIIQKKNISITPEQGVKDYSLTKPLLPGKYILYYDINAIESGLNNKWSFVLLDENDEGIYWTGHMNLDKGSSKITFEIQDTATAIRIDSYEEGCIADIKIMQILTQTIENRTKFYFDIGHPTLVCKVNNDEKITEQISGVTYKYSYEWGYEDKNVGFEILNSNVEQPTVPVAIDGTVFQKTYNELLSALWDLKREIENGTKYPNVQAENIENLQGAIKSFNKIQRIKDNRLYDVQINEITQLKVFKCSVFRSIVQGSSISNETYLGTASITLINSLEEQNRYTLIINNGTAAYQYNENGIAPNNGSLNNPQQIKALSFTVYDDFGQKIDTQELIKNKDNCKIRWKIPIKDTLLVDNNAGENDGIDETLSYIYYDDQTTLNYDIVQLYDVNKKNNQIELTVDYKGIHLVATTNFTFVKQGEPGTNGTEYIVKIVPRTNMPNPPAYPALVSRHIIYGGGQYFDFGIGSSELETQIAIGQSCQPFKAQLWHNGQLVWQGIYPKSGNNDGASALDGTTLPSSVKWGILRNKYTNRKTRITINGQTIEVDQDTEKSSFIMNENGSLAFLGGDIDMFYHLHNGSYVITRNTHLANIIKCSITWQGKTYYGTLPITRVFQTSGLLHPTGYRIRLKENTGFRYVMYTSDGILPQYDNTNPFEFIVQKYMNNTWEDISLVNGQNQLEYNFSVIASRMKPDSNPANSWIEEDLSLLEILSDSVYTQDCEKNQVRLRPASTYDGGCVTAAITCSVRRKNLSGTGAEAAIQVPIHFLLNRYGLSNLNAWDGNSIQISDDGGYILAPQIGAGQKEGSTNAFTGVLMGKVQQSGKNTEDIGLMGYSDGQRTFFLNSQRGAAIFGKASGGQIMIDPRNITVDNQPMSGQALLYSRNYWKNYDADFPSSYNESNVNRTERSETISNTNLWKDGSVSVASTSYTINNNSYVIDDEEADTVYLIPLQKTTIDTSGLYQISFTANRAKGTSTKFSFGFTDDEANTAWSRTSLSFGTAYAIGRVSFTTSKIMYLLVDIGKKDTEISFSNITIKKYTDKETSGQGMLINLAQPKIDFGSGYFSVDKKGKLIAKNAQITGRIVANSGTIGGWKITSDDIRKEFKQSSGYNVLLNGDSRDTTVLAIGAKWKDTTYTQVAWGQAPFRVNKDGKFYATNAVLSGTITSVGNNANIAIVNGVIQCKKGNTIYGTIDMIDEYKQSTDKKHITISSNNITLSATNQIQFIINNLICAKINSNGLYADLYADYIASNRISSKTGNLSISAQSGYNISIDSNINLNKHHVSNIVASELGVIDGFNGNFSDAQYYNARIINGLIIY